MRRIISCVCFFVFIFTQSPSIFAQYYYPRRVPSQAQIQKVGIPSNQMDYFFAKQDKPQWCWAASIQMVMNYYGVDISQWDIVYRTYGTDPYGRLPDWSGSIGAISANLNNWNIDKSGRSYAVRSIWKYGSPQPTEFLSELISGRPIILGYKSGYGSGHAVVVTGASFISTKMGPIIQSVTVRDPWPSRQNIINNGKVVYSGAEFAGLMEAYWYIRVK